MSLAQRRAHASPLEKIAARVEEEVKRLKEMRPALSDRLDRAAAILITHLSCRRQRLIRVRVRDGRARFLMSGAHGAVYVVDPEDWSCSCPDHHRRNHVCKHALAGYILWLSSLRKRKLLPCCSCGECFPRWKITEVQHEHNNEVYFPGDLLCRGCARRAGIQW